MAKSRQCLEPRPVESVCVAVAWMSVGGVLCVIAVAVAVVGVVILCFLLLALLFPLLLFPGVFPSLFLSSRPFHILSDPILTW